MNQDQINSKIKDCNSKLVEYKNLLDSILQSEDLDNEHVLIRVETVMKDIEDIASQLETLINNL